MTNTSPINNENKNSEEFWDGYHSIAAAWKNIFRLEKCNTDTGLCKVCDAGCGKGQLVWALRNIGVEAWGFDIDKLAIENRYKKCQDGWIKKHDAVMVWPYGGRAFDLVVVVDLFEHINLKDIDIVISEMYRVAKKWIFLRLSTRTVSGRLQDRQFWIDKLSNNLEHKWVLRDDMVQRYIELVPKNVVGDLTNSTIIILERLKRKDYDKSTLETIFDNAINKKKENINVSGKEIKNGERKKREFDKDLTDLLVKNKDMLFGVAEPGGNSGDLLIYKGLYKKLRDLNIRYEDIRYDKENVQFGKAEIVLMQGGSNVNDLWGSGTELLKNIISSCKLPIIVAPQTYYFTRTDFPDIFKGSTQKIYLFCREEESYSRLKKLSLPGNVSIHVSDDTAFYMEKEDFLSFGQHRVEKGKYYTLLCFRGDHESVFRDAEGIGPKIIGTLREIVRNHNMEIVERDLSMDVHSWISFDYFVRYIQGAKIVITDRLHVAILAAILEKPTILFSGAYFKSKAVYEYTLKYFPYTIFLE